jgi:hypothetical protein
MHPSTMPALYAFADCIGGKIVEDASVHSTEGQYVPVRLSVCLSVCLSEQPSIFVCKG